MKLKVQVTRESVKKSDKQKLEVEVPCHGTEEGVMWSAKFTEEALEELTKLIRKKIENSQEYIHILYEVVWLKMRSKLPPLESVHPDMFKYIDEVLIAFTNSIIEMQKIDKIPVKQKKLRVPK